MILAGASSPESAPGGAFPSRHLSGHAVDLAAVVAGKVRWDWPLYDRLAGLMFSAATTEDVPLEWGGRWPKLRDGPHFQLPRKEYPVVRPTPASTQA